VLLGHGSLRRLFTLCGKGGEWKVGAIWLRLRRKKTEI
jgi:hypothetical protein